MPAGARLVQANTVRLGWAACVLIGVACTLPNPCPKGRARGDRCVQLIPDAATHSSESEPSPKTTEPNVSSEASEAGSEADADRPDLPDSMLDAGPTSSVDSASADAADMDAQLSSTTEASLPLPSEASAVEASTDADRTTAPDASETEDVSTPEPTACSMADLHDWRTFQLGNLALLETERCYDLDPDCSDGSCDIGNCMRQAAHVTGCEECVRSELLCMTRHCAAVCSAPNAFDDCRKCACLSNCMSGEDSCGASDVAICDDCSVAGCTALSVLPAIVMQVVNHVTLIVPLPGM